MDVMYIGVAPDIYEAVFLLAKAYLESFFVPFCQVAFHMCFLLSFKTKCSFWLLGDSSYSQFLTSRKCHVLHCTGNML